MTSCNEYFSLFVLVNVRMAIKKFLEELKLYKILKFLFVKNLDFFQVSVKVRYSYDNIYIIHI